MKLVALFAGILLLLFLLNYLRFLCKRISMAWRIRKACKAYGATRVNTHPFPILSRNDATLCDFYVETKQTVYAVKLLGAVRKTSQLFFFRDRTYQFKELRMVSFWRITSFSSGKKKPLPQYNFRYGYRSEWELKTPKKILLINPVGLDILREEPDGTNSHILPGEQIYGMEIHTVTTFIQELRGHCL